jgi:hypothetical protein
MFSKKQRNNRRILTVASAIAIVASAAVVSFGLVAYFLRRKTQEKANPTTKGGNRQFQNPVNFCSLIP